jgi:hypothetical protein
LPHEERHDGESDDKGGGGAGEPQLERQRKVEALAEAVRGGRQRRGD